MKTFLQFFFLFLFVSSIIHSQNNITNTLGTGGTFTIKDGSATLFSLAQNTGYLNLPSGVIFKGSESFIHDYAPTGSPGGNTFVGIKSGNFTTSFISNLDGSLNTGIGYGTLSNLTTGYGNTATGESSLRANTTGINNTAVGNYSQYDNTSGNFNTSTGAYSLASNTTGSSNTATGNNSLFGNTTGNYNTTIGAYSLASNTTGSQNTAAGYGSLYTNTTGYYNTAFGYYSLTTNKTGFHNTAVGHNSLQNNTGSYNTALGFNAGSTVTSGFNLTLLGIDAAPSSPTTGNQITLGNTFVTSLRCAVQNISSLSDERDKKNIKELDLGIDFLMKIKPRLFNWDKREWYENNVADGQKMQELPTAGFIAQELDEVQAEEDVEWLNLVLKDNPEKLEATPGNLLPIIVKAIQDLKKENDELKDRLKSFEQIQNKLLTEIERTKEKDNESTLVSMGE